MGKRNYYRKCDEYTKFRIRAYHEKLYKYRLGLKCRDKWLRRRNKVRFNTDDKIYLSLYNKAEKYYSMLTKILGKKHV